MQKLNPASALSASLRGGTRADPGPQLRAHATRLPSPTAFAYRHRLPPPRHSQVDIAIRFRTCIYNEDFDNMESDVIMDPKVLAVRYLRSSFFVDLLASFPLDWFAGGAGLRSLTAQCVRLNRVLHMHRVFSVHFDQVCATAATRPPVSELHGCLASHTCTGSCRCTRRVHSRVSGAEGALTCAHKRGGAGRALYSQLHAPLSARFFYACAGATCACAACACAVVSQAIHLARMQWLAVLWSLFLLFAHWVACGWCASHPASSIPHPHHPPPKLYSPRPFRPPLLILSLTPSTVGT